MSDVIPIHQPLSVTSEIVRMDAAMAERYLALNNHNSPLNERIVIQYAADMEEGRWQFNGEAVKISADGVLLDGQHRLKALSLTKGVFIEILVIRGLPATSQTTMDQGRKRSAADQLTLAGIAATTNVAAAVRVLLTWERGLLFSDRKMAISTTEIVEWGQGNPVMLDHIRRASAYVRVKARSGVTAAVYARIADIHGVDVADSFFQGLLHGLNLDEGSPILPLRNRLDRLRDEGLKVSDRDMIGYFVATFNYWITGRTVARLQQPKGGWAKGNFPDVLPTAAVPTAIAR